MRLEEEKLRTISCYHGVVVNTRLDQARLPDGSLTLREVVEHPGGVAVLPLEKDGTVWCVRQFRYPFAETLLEVPAGSSSPARIPKPPRGASSPRRRGLRRASCGISGGTTALRATTARSCTSSLPAI